MNKSGTYIFDKTTSKTVKVSDRVPVIKKIPDWKRNMNPEDEQRRGYASMDEKGTLPIVNDKEVWRDFLRR